MLKVVSLLLSTLILAGCGGGPEHGTPTQDHAADGTWTASTSSPADGPTPPTFTFTMQYCCGSMMNISNLKMTASTPCFGPSSVMAAAGQMSGGTMGPGTRITMDLWSEATYTGNHLQLIMVMSEGMRGMTGTYTLTGVTPGCPSGSGTLQMSHQASVH